LWAAGDTNHPQLHQETLLCAGIAEALLAAAAAAAAAGAVELPAAGGPAASLLVSRSVVRSGSAAIKKLVEMLGSIKAYKHAVQLFEVGGWPHGRVVELG
jgi:hypothetical protein